MDATPMTPGLSRALEIRLATAKRLATEAGAMAIRLRPASGAPSGTLKGAQDWLTEADGAIEAMLSRALAEAHPEDAFQGEETGFHPGRGGKADAWRWVVDPIDGTSNYARGSARWCVSIGLIGGRVPLLGVVNAAASGELFAGYLGGGATRNDEPIRVADTTDAARAMVEIGWSPRVPAENYVATVGNVMALGAATRSTGSGAMGLADVACGRFDAYIERHINLWDIAGMLPILTEAGARLSPFMDGTGVERGGPLLAATPGLFDALRKVLDL